MFLATIRHVHEQWRVERVLFQEYIIIRIIMVCKDSPTYLFLIIVLHFALFHLRVSPRSPPLAMIFPISRSYHVLLEEATG
jgi:hypothetical protein